MDISLACRPPHVADDPPSALCDAAVVAALAARLGPSVARARIHEELGIEARAVVRTDVWRGRAIRAVLAGTGMLGRAGRNAVSIRVLHNSLRVPNLPASFRGFALLQVSDLHADSSPRAMAALRGLLPSVGCDACVFTGDFRGLAHGPCEPSLNIVAGIAGAVRAPMYGVLGNHDSALMVAPLEDMSIRLLMNESVALHRDGATLWLAGVDDHHHYAADRIGEAMRDVPAGGACILLSHTPENFREAALAGAGAMLSGHTHGGQICLPGGIHLATSSRRDLPRQMVSGAWSHAGMQGYTSTGAGTSLLEARFNCPPSVTLHVLSS